MNEDSLHLRGVPLQRWMRVILIATVAGALYGAWFGNLLSGAITGAFTGGLLSFLEIFVLGRTARRSLVALPFAAFFALRVLIYAAAIVGVNIAIPGRFSEAEFLRGLAFAFAMSIAVNLLFAVNDLLGPGVLFAFAAGRYRRPRREERVIVYLDLCGSTALTEQLGEERFLDLLNAFFADVTGEIVREHGEVHKFVGDEVIAVWPAGANVARPIRACFAAATQIEAKADEYKRGYGAVPAFRAAIHAGPVVIGELGAWKKEIALIGDAMNTAARILETTRETGSDVLVSAETFDRMRTPPQGVAARRLDPIPLRGKAAPLALVALAREALSVAPARVMSA